MQDHKFKSHRKRSANLCTWMIPRHFQKNELETFIQTMRIYSLGIGMEFGIEKCAMLIMKSGKQVKDKE